jgi:two-component system response regulator NreC
MGDDSIQHAHIGGDPSRPVKIVIADDHGVVRSGLRALLETEDDMEVVAEAEDVASTIHYVSAHRPTALVLDLHMAGEDSISALPDIRAASPETRIVMLTMDADTVFAREALRQGATGYVLKQAANAELVAAVRQALEGRTYLHPELGARLAAEPAEAGGAPGDLSEREAEVLRLIALGHTNTEIASQLYLSVRTVESHRAHIQRKLGLSTRAELVRFALDNGLMAGDGD